MDKDINDIARLYRRFGGNPELYQEVGRARKMDAVLARWPVLAFVRTGLEPISLDGDICHERHLSLDEGIGWPPVALVPAIGFEVNDFETSDSGVGVGALVSTQVVSDLIERARMEYRE